MIAAAEKEKQLRQELTRLEAQIPPAPRSADPTRRLDARDIEALRAQERLLKDTIDQSMQTNATKGDATLRYAILKREVEINRSLYNEMLSRLNEITISAGVGPATAEIFEPARLPGAPISPNHPQALILGLVAGLLLGLTAGGLRDHLDQSLRDPDEANNLLQAPVLGIIPDHHKPHKPGKGIEELLVGADQETPLAEAYRVLRSHIEGRPVARGSIRSPADQRGRRAKGSRPRRRTSPPPLPNRGAGCC